MSKDKTIKEILEDEKDLKVIDNNLIYKNEKFLLNNIRHLSFEITKITQRQNYVKVGNPLMALIEIIFDNGSSIEVKKDERTFLHDINTNKKEEINDLYNTFTSLLEITKESRLSKYFKEIEKLGYFKYGDSRWFPKNKIEHGRKTYYIDDYKILRSKNTIFLENKNKNNIIKRFLNYLNNPQFNMDKYDIDIIFYILEKTFGWKFK
jgi:hypothetical protein